MNDVFIIGIGEAQVEKKSSLSLRELGAKVVKEAMAHAGVSKIDALYVGNMLSGIIAHQEQLGCLIASSAGLTGVEAMTVEAACASGGAALHLGVLAIASGMYDCVAICGIEKMSDVGHEEISSSLATASDWETEGSNGETFISLNAKIMQDYIHYYGVPREAFGSFAINAHKNAMTNPYALFHKPITQQDYDTSRILEDPIRLYDACPICDGAATLILASKSFIESIPKSSPRVRIRASTVATDIVGLKARKSLHVLEGAIHSSQLAYQQAKVTPEDIDVFELHDAYSIIAVLSLEAAGFAKPGKGFELGLIGDITLRGRIPIATYGGLKARGHPIGATGIYQIVEIIQQLTHQAGENQVPGAVIAMAQSIGGCGGTVMTHILERIE